MTQLRPIAEWKATLAELPDDPEVRCAEGRSGQPTLKIGKVLLHSRYNPEEEARHFIDSAELDPKRPVLVVGLGLGYHVRELCARGFDVAVTEARPAVVKAALTGPLEDADVLLAAGPAGELEDCAAFQAFARRLPQVLVHPASARVSPEHAEAATRAVSRAALRGRHLSVAVVGPMYGGSLPIAGYLADAFKKLGHRCLLVDNAPGWPLYQAVQDSVEDAQACEQLTRIQMNFLSEWCYARVAEFNPEICIVLAQAPVNDAFPHRLAKQGILTGYWYVENWRHMGYWKEIAPRYDAFFHIQPGEFEAQLEAAGCAHHDCVQTACDPDVHKPVEVDDDERRAYGCDLSFAGAGYYNRLQVLKGLTDYDFKIWGVEWSEPSLSRCLAEGEKRFDAEIFNKIVAASKINLNLHASKTSPGVDEKADAINPRVFEIAAAGGFQLCDPCIGLDALFDLETELPAYRNLKELRARIDHFLAHPDERRAIAERARARVHAEHTYAHRAEQMLDFLIERHGAQLLKRGVRIQHTAAEMAEQLEAGSELAGWLKTLPPDTPFLQEELFPFLRKGRPEATHPEKLLLYMSEVKHFSEALLKARR